MAQITTVLRSAHRPSKEFWIRVRETHAPIIAPHPKLYKLRPRYAFRAPAATT